jgi:hypothetical protein
MRKLLVGELANKLSLVLIRHGGEFDHDMGFA